MKGRERRISGGFGVVELLFSSALAAIVIMIAYNSYILTKDTSIYVFEKNRMQLKAIYILESMVRGVENYKGIQEAQDLVNPTPGGSGTLIEFIDQDDPDPGNPTITRKFFIYNNEVMYENAAGTQARIDIDDTTDNDVQTLTFTRPTAQNDLIIINLILSGTVLGKDVSVDLSTKVELRN